MMTDSAIRIRQLKKTDAAALSLLEKEIFGENAWSERDFIETLSLNYAYYLVAEETESGRVIGACGYRNMCGEADITNVLVSPDMRRRGIAERMLKLLMEHGLGHGVKDFTLEVRSKNKGAIELYKKIGFRSEGVRPDFYDRPKDDALIMWNRKTQKDA